MGGQEGDIGVIETANGKFVVEDTIKLRGGKFGHVGQVTKGMIKVGKKKYREEPQRNTPSAEGIKDCSRCARRAERFSGNTGQTSF